ncbi:Hypothetical predicted protein, partial [Paramuricea clavata]
MPPKKTDPDKLVVMRVKFDTTNDRLEKIIKKVESSLETMSSANASAFFAKISSLAIELERSFTDIVEAVGSSSPDVVKEVKLIYNNTAAECDLSLVAIGALAHPEGIPPPDKHPKEERQRKVDFRKFEKECPKSWFEQLEVVFKAMHIDADYQRFAALLKLVDHQAGALLSSITRANPKDAYVQARK